MALVAVQFPGPHLFFTTCPHLKAMSSIPGPIIAWEVPLETYLCQSQWKFYGEGQWATPFWGSFKVQANLIPTWLDENELLCSKIITNPDDVIKWKYFLHYWPFVLGIHWSPVNPPPKGQWRATLRLSLIYTQINGWVKNREADELRRHHVHYHVIVMCWRHNR